MRQSKTYEINGRKYLIGHWQVDKSLKTLVWLTKTFGEGFVTLFTSGAAEDLLSTPEEGEEVKEKEVDPEEEARLLKEFISNIIDRLDEDAYVKYARLVIEGVKCNGRDINFGQHFIGRMGELHKLMFEILKLQYSDFLGAGQEGDLSEG